MTQKDCKQDLGGVDDKLKGIQRSAIISLGAISAGLLTAGTMGVKFNAQLEQYQTSFEVMTGSATEASSIVERLKKIGAQTPFELTDVADATQLLMNYGFTADGAIDSMMMLGDISQGSSEKMNRIAMAYGQMSSAGKVQLEDVKQMIEAGFNPLNEISETTGESMESLYDRISKGTISVDEISASMKRSTSEGGKYYQSMEKQSKTVNGMLSTLSDTVKNKMGEAFQSTSDIIKKMLPSLISFIENLDVKEVAKWIGILAGSIGGVLVVVTALRGAIKLFDIVTMVQQLGGLNAMFTALTANIGTVVATIAPLIATAVAIIAVIALVTTAIYQLWNENEVFRQTVTNAWNSIMDTLTLFWNVVGKPIFDAITRALLNIWENGIKPLWDAFKEFIANLVMKLAEFWESIKPIVDFFITVFGPIIVNALTWVADSFGNMVSIVMSLLGALLKNIGEIIGGVIDVFGGIIDFIVGIFTGDWEKAWNGILRAFKGIFDQLYGIAKIPINLIIGLINGMIGGVESGINYIVRAVNGLSFDLPDWLGGGHFGFDLNEVSFGRVAYLERGGILPKGKTGYLEGNGAEAVIPLDQNKYWTKSVARQMLQYMPRASKTETNQTVNFYSPVETPDQVSMRMRHDLRKGMVG